MSWTRSIILIVFLVLLALFYFRKINPNFSPKPSAPAAKSLDAYVLPLRDPDEVKGLSFSDYVKKAKFAFKRTDNGWNIVSPIRYPAESVVVDGFISILRLSPRLRNLPTEYTSLKDLGLSEPRLKVCVSFASSGRKRCVDIGSEAALGNGTMYAKWRDEHYYFLVDEMFLKTFDISLYSLRKKQIFNLSEKDVASIAFQSQKKDFLIVRENQTWVLKKPMQAIVGPQAIQNLLAQLSNLYVKEFMDEPAPKKRSFKTPARLIKVVYRDGTEQLLTQSGKAVGREAFMAKLSDPESVFLVSSIKLNYLEEAFSSLLS